MENQNKKHFRNRREEATVFRKECAEKGISTIDAMKEHRFNKLNKK